MPFFERRDDKLPPDPSERLRQVLRSEAGAAPSPSTGSSESLNLNALVDEVVGSLVPEPAPPPPSVAAAPAGGTAAPDEAAPARAERFFPQRPTTIEETGLSRVFLNEHIVRTVYFAGEITAGGVAEALGLPFMGVLDGLIEGLRRENVLEVKGQRGIGEAGYVLGLTERGTIRAHEALQKVQYRGPAPVPLDQYSVAMRAQSNRNVVVTQDTIRAAFQDLLIADSVLDEVGPAVNSGSSMFLFGYPGNGKTSIAERITRLLGDNIFVPYAVAVDGAIIKLFDSVVHEPVEPPRDAPRLGLDRRWVEIKRPTVVVGGELTMASLDLLYNDVGRYYEAPLQMKANGGMFLIDDFGRQLIRPVDLLNRWIVPLEKRVDFLTLITGKKITIPFEELIVFSTNLDPTDLVDEAFLRRIKFKINVVDPDLEQFKAIFRMVAAARGIEYREEGVEYLLERYYRPPRRPLRMCHPRDLLDQLIAIAKYKMRQPEMTPDLLDLVAQTYFVTVGRE